MWKKIVNEYDQEIPQSQTADSGKFISYEYNSENRDTAANLGKINRFAHISMTQRF